MHVHGIHRIGTVFKPAQQHNVGRRKMLRAYLLRGAYRLIYLHVRTKSFLGSNVSTVTRNAPLHTTAVLSVESARKRQARLTRQKNLAKRSELSKQASSTRPHVILGTISSDSSSDTWTSCDLARVLVRPDELSPTAPSQPIHIPEAANAEVNIPPTLAFGIREQEQRMLFAHMPLLAADMHTRREMNGGSSVNAVADMAAHHERALEDGVKQANVLAKLVDLRNANAAGIAFENRRRVVEAFSEPGKPNDTGRTEVQGACVCAKPAQQSLIWDISGALDFADTQAVESSWRL
jgi:small subunit ribosomal protein S15